MEQQGQAVYDTVVLSAEKNIFGDAKDDTRFKMVLQRLQSGKDDIAGNIGGIAGVTLSNIQGAAQKQGKDIPGDVLTQAADEIVDRLIDIAVTGKLMDEQQTDQVKKKALFEALKVLGTQDLKTMTPEKKAKAQEAVSQLKSGARPPSQGVIGSRMGQPGAMQ